MRILGRNKKRRSPNPLLNLFWLVALLPVAVILYRLWQKQLPWMEGTQSRTTSRARRPSRPARQEKVPAHKEAGAEPQGRRGEERRPDEKKQKDPARPEGAGRRRRAQPEPALGDELEVIEGIGPKTAELLRSAGIWTFRQLANAPVERLDAILRDGGIRIHPPDTWPEQARLAADGDWEGLEQLKGQLRAGRRNKE